MAAGFLSSLHYLNLAACFGVVVIADIVADSLYFGLGRLGREHGVARWGKFVGVTPEIGEKLRRQFEKRGGTLLFIGKVSHGIGGAFLVAAGLSSIPYSRFLFFDGLATLPKSVLLLAIGYYFGESLVKADWILGFVGVAVIVIAAVLVLPRLNSRAEKIAA